MILKKIDIKEFKKVIYPAYKKIFPQSERKSYRLIKKSFEENITQIIEILEEGTVVGFLTINTIKNAKYSILDYLAILPEYQNKGYGTKAITLLKEQRKNQSGIIIEIEKCGLGENEEENKIREKREQFYQRLGFCKMAFDIELFKVIYSILILSCQESNQFNEDEVIQDMFNIYISIYGRERAKKNCRVIKERLENI